MLYVVQFDLSFSTGRFLETVTGILENDKHGNEMKYKANSGWLNREQGYDAPWSKTKEKNC